MTSGIVLTDMSRKMGKESGRLIQRWQEEKGNFTTERIKKKLFSFSDVSSYKGKSLT